MIECSICLYGDVRISIEGNIWMCRDEEGFINEETGELCCRHYVNAIKEEEYYEKEELMNKDSSINRTDYEEHMYENSDSVKPEKDKQMRFNREQRRALRFKKKRIMKEINGSEEKHENSYKQ